MTKPDAESLKERIRAAFAKTERPPSDRIRNSSLGCEPFEVEDDFKDKNDWRVLPSEFLDASPGGLGSALSFLSNEAFRFFLPAFLIADIDDALASVTPFFHLTHGVDDLTRDQVVNPNFYGDQTWFDLMKIRFDQFSDQEAGAIVDYLRFVAARDDIPYPEIEQALRNYWLGRVSDR